MEKTHDTKLYIKPKTTPVTCVLYKGNHPSNYKGYLVYQDLLCSKMDSTHSTDIIYCNPDFFNHLPLQHWPTSTYAQVAVGNGALKQLQPLKPHQWEQTEQTL